MRLIILGLLGLFLLGCSSVLPDYTVVGKSHHIQTAGSGGQSGFYLTVLFDGAAYETYVGDQFSDIPDCFTNATLGSVLTEDCR